MAPSVRKLRKWESCTQSCYSKAKRQALPFWKCGCGVAKGQYLYLLSVGRFSETGGLLVNADVEIQKAGLGYMDG